MASPSLETSSPDAPGLEHNEPSDSTAATRPWWRRRWPWAALLVVILLAAAGVGARAVVYIHTYQPLRPGELGANPQTHSVRLTDGVHDTEIIVTGPRGTQARIALSIRNTGSHSVRLLGLPPSSGIDRITWGPVVTPSGEIGGGAAHGQPFPMTLSAGRQVSLWIYLTQPNCRDSYAETLDDVPIRWRAFDVSHLYNLSLTDGSFLPITLCAPAKALKDVDHF